MGGVANISNSGINVNQRAESHLKLLTFLLRHQARISKTVNAPDTTKDAIHELGKFEASYKKPEDFPAINAKD